MMKKRVLGVLMAVAMVLCAIPLSVSAETTGIFIGAIMVTPGNTYTSENNSYITKGSVKVEETSATELTITLTDAVIEPINDVDDEIVFGVGVTNEKYTTVNIVLAGEYNAIALQGRETTYGLAVDGNLNISGDAVLDIYVKAGQTNVGIDYGIVAVKTLNINGATIIIDKADKSQISGAGIRAYDVNFNGAAVVTENTEAATQGIYATHDVNYNLTKGGKVTAKCNSVNFSAVETGSINTITLADKNVITTPTDGVVQVNGSLACIAASEKSSVREKVSVVEYVEPAKEEAKAAGANTGDSNDIALFALMGIMALAGAGIVGFKKREN